MNYLVLGCGHSGISACTLLRKKNHPVFVYDDHPYTKKIITELQPLHVQLLDKNGAQQILQSDHCAVVISPGVPSSHHLVKQARENKLSILSEVELALQSYHGKIVAVTGTNGKSTTAKMCHHILTSLGLKTQLAGNIGRSVSSVVLEEKLYDFLVLELSSYQIEQSQNINPNISIFTTFSEDHLERHKTMKNYFQIKWRIFQSTRDGFIGICDKTIYQQHQHYKSSIQTKKPFVVDYKNYSEISSDMTHIKEKHNLQNATLATLACSFLTRHPTKKLAALLKTFKAIPYRYEKITCLENKVVINDSKSTNLESTKAAIESSKGPLILLLGGICKSRDFSTLRTYKDHITCIIAFGKSSQAIHQNLHLYFLVYTFSTLKEVMNSFCDMIKKTKCCTILFSPAGASQDEFNNFEERGEFFTKEIKSLINKEDKEHRCYTSSTDRLPSQTT